MKKRSLLKLGAFFNSLMIAGTLVVGEKAYAVNKGWVQKGSLWYYYNNDGTKYYGWLKDNGYWYYFNEHHNDGSMDCNTSTGGPKFNNVFDSKGRWIDKQGWFCLISNPQNGVSCWSYIDKDLTSHIGWLKDNGYWYYFYPSRDCWINQPTYKVQYEHFPEVGKPYMDYSKPYSGSTDLIKEHHFDDKGRLIYTKNLRTSEVTYY